MPYFRVTKGARMWVLSFLRALSCLASKMYIVKVQHYKTDLQFVSTYLVANLNHNIPVPPSHRLLCENCIAKYNNALSSAIRDGTSINTLIFIGTSLQYVKS